MFRLYRDIKIDESSRVVWAYMSNLTMSLTCNRYRRQIRWHASPVPELGSRFSVDHAFLGLRFEYQARVAGWEPPVAVTIVEWPSQQTGRGFTHQYSFRVVRIQGQSRATLLEYEISGSLGPHLVELPFRQLISNVMSEELLNLKRAIESTDKTDLQLVDLPMAGAG